MLNPENHVKMCRLGEFRWFKNWKRTTLVIYTKFSGKISFSPEEEFLFKIPKAKNNMIISSEDV